MAKLRITNFGGLIPQVSPRALPSDAAQTAHNLQSNTREFRPMLADSTAIANTGAASNPLTIFRFSRNADGSLNTDFADASKWRISSYDWSYVKAQINNDTTDRHYASRNDGGAAPRVIDATGSDRQLGVPAPTTAPGVTVTTVDEFTTEERTAAIETAIAAAVKAVKDLATPAWIGSSLTGLHGGYYDRKTASGFTPEDLSQQVRVYGLSADGGAISNAYSTTVAASAFSWVLDPGLSPFTVTLASVHHTAIAFPAYGMSYTLNTATLETALAAIAMPGKTDGTKLLTAEQAEELAGEIGDYLDPDVASVSNAVNALAAKAMEVRTILDGGARSSLEAVTEDFYDQDDVADEVTAAIAVAAESAWKLADTMAHSYAHVMPEQP